MKLESVVIWTKLFCVFAGTSLLTLQTGLGQWSQEGKAPTTVQWVMVLGGSLGTGLTAAGAFLSNSFGTYMGARGVNGNGNGTVPQLPQNKPLTTPKKDDTLPPVL